MPISAFACCSRYTYYTRIIFSNEGHTLTIYSLYSPLCSSSSFFGYLSILMITLHYGETQTFNTDAIAQFRQMCFLYRNEMGHLGIIKWQSHDNKANAAHKYNCTETVMPVLPLHK